VIDPVALPLDLFIMRNQATSNVAREIEKSLYKIHIQL
jgi:hypothetical protein